MQCLNFPFFTFASFYKTDGFDGFYESLSVRRGGVFLLFFPYLITFYLLGYFRIVFFSLTVTWFCDFSFLERSKMGVVFGCDICFFRTLPSNPSPLPLTPFVSLRGFSTFVLPLELVLGRASFCSYMFLLLLRRVFLLFLMGSLSLSLYRDSGSFVFPSFNY